MGIFPEGSTGGAASFSQLNDHIAAGGNITTGWNASSEVITISATGFTGNNIAGASDVTITSVTNGQILIRSGNAFVNATVTGSGNITISATAGALNISGTQLSILAGENISATITNNIATISATNSDTLRSMTDTDISSLTSGHILIWNGNNFQNRSIQGDVTLSTNGTITIGNKKVSLPKIDGGTSSGFLYTDASGNLTASAVTQGGGSTFTRANIIAGSNITLTNSGTDNVVISAANTGGGGGTNITVSDTPTINLTLSNNVLSANVINNSISGAQISASINVLSDVNASANTQAAGDILIWDTSASEFYNYGLSGDVSMTYSGVVTISTGAVTTDKIKDNSITTAKINVGSNNSGKVLKVNSAGNAAEWATDDTATGGSGITRANIIAGAGITTSNSGASNVIINSNAGKTKRFIDFGNDTTTNIAAGDFVAGLEGEDGNGNFVGEKADTANKVPIGVADVAIAGKESDGSDENVVERSVFVVGSHNIPSGDIDGSFSGARDRQAVYLKWVTNAWKVTLEKTQWMCGTHHNGDVIFDFVAMHSSQDIGDQLVSTVSAFSGDIDRDNDGLLIDDNGTAKNIDWNTFEAVTEPIHTKQQLSLTGYQYSTSQSVTAGQFHLQANADLSVVRLIGVAKSGDEERFKALMTSGFQLQIATGSGNGRVEVVGVVQGIAIQGSAIIATFVPGSITKTTANFSNDQSLTFTSFGRHPSWSSFEFNRHPNNLGSRVIASTQWVSEYVADSFGDTKVTGFTALTGGSTPDANKEVVWDNTNKDFEFFLNAASYAEMKPWLEPGYYMEFYTTNTFETLERCKISTASALTNNILTIVVTDQWIRSTAHQGAASNIGIRFVGKHKFEAEQERRFQTQTATGNFGRGENISATGTTRFAATFSRGAGSSRLGRFGPNSASNNGGNISNYIINNTQFAAMSDYLGFRAKHGYNYIVTVAVQGVFNFNNVSSNETYGLEVGLNWRAFNAGATPSGDWQTCEARNNTQGNVSYHYQKFAIADNGGNVTRMSTDSNSGVAQALAFYRGKVNPGSATTLDHGPTARYSFMVGNHDNAVFAITQDTDFEFDPIYDVAQTDQGLGNAYALNWDLRVVQEM